MNCEDVPEEWRNYTKFKDEENIWLEILLYQAFDIQIRRKALPGEECKTTEDCYQSSYREHECVRTPYDGDEELTTCTGN